MTTARWIGAVMIAVPFLLVFAHGVRSVGWKTTLTVLGGLLALVAWVTGAVLLLAPEVRP